MLRAAWTILVVIALGPPGNARAQATIEGAVRLPAPAAGAPPTARYQMKTSGGVDTSVTRRSVVFLEGNSIPAPADMPLVRMEQKNFQFNPRLLAIQRGTRVTFPNLDDDYHNVLSYSKAKEFDLGRYRKEERSPTLAFDKAGVVELGCEIHEHMQATIIVLDTPYFTSTDTDGHYRLENLPAGKFTLKAWLNKKTTWSEPIELKSGQVLRVDFPPPAPPQ